MFDRIEKELTTSPTWMKQSPKEKQAERKVEDKPQILCSKYQ